MNKKREIEAKDNNRATSLPPVGQRGQPSDQE
jgi:hypothetical protein